MESQEEYRARIKSIIERLRAVTLTVQLMPFIYSALFIIVLVIYYFCGDATMKLLDSLFYVSPITIIMLLVLSRTLKLCRWHKTACCIPIIPQIISLVDYYIITLSQAGVIVGLFTILTMTTLLLISAYKVFFTNGR